jgi:predicted dehydrogenase
MKRYGMGVVGAGIMGQRMVSALKDHPRWRVAAVWDPDSQAMARAVSASPASRSVTGLEGLMADSTVDAVYIASPPSSHVEGVRATLASGRPCLCEKPLAHSVEGAVAIDSEVRRSGLPFAVNFPFACAAASRQLVALVEGGQLGRVESASITLRFARWPREWQQGASSWLDGPLQGGFAREVLSHFVFLSQRLFGPATVELERLDREPGRSETRLLARLLHGTVRVQIDAAVEGDVPDHNRFEVIGSRDRAALTGWYRLEHRGQTSERVDASAATLDAFARLMEGDHATGLARVDEGLGVVRCVEGLLAPSS